MSFDPSLNSFKLKPDPCPHCGIQHTGAAATALFGRKPRLPKSGDITFCIDCGSWAIYEPGGRRIPTDSEQEEIERMPHCRDISRLWRAEIRPTLKKA